MLYRQLKLYRYRLFFKIISLISLEKASICLSIVITFDKMS